MKIAIIAHLKFPIAEPFAGGLEMLTHVLAKKLGQKGHQVDVYACSGSDMDLNIVEINVKGVDCESTKDITPDHESFNDEFMQTHHAYLDIMLQLQDKNYDIIHNNSLHYIPISMARTIDTPMVTTIHVPPFAFMQSATLLAQKHPNNHYISISEHVAETWYDYIKESEIIYNGVDTDFWSYQPKVEGDNAVWFGRICPEKAPHLALKAARKSNTFLYLAGNMSNQEYFDKEVAPLLDDRYNCFLGHLKQEQMRDYFHKASVFLFTSMWEEPYGLVLAESLSCGTPVAAFKSGASPEIITSKTGRIVEKGNVDQLASAITACKKLDRKDCRQRAIDFCDIDLMIDNYEDHFQRLIFQEKSKKRISTTSKKAV